LLPPPRNGVLGHFWLLSHLAFLGEASVKVLGEMDDVYKGAICSISLFLFLFLFVSLHGDSG
jgi:hypothetical protein